MIILCLKNTVFCSSQSRTEAALVKVVNDPQNERELMRKKALPVPGLSDVSVAFDTVDQYASAEQT